MIPIPSFGNLLPVLLILENEFQRNQRIFAEITQAGMAHVLPIRGNEPMTVNPKSLPHIVPLFKSKMGQFIRIHRLPQGKLRSFFLRLGIREGEYVECYERLPGGTVVIKKNRQEIAIGHELARDILVVIERVP